jgi:hypothetical protein
MSQVVHNKVLDRIYGKGRGWVFTPKRFLDLGSRSAVDKALNRLADAVDLQHDSGGWHVTDAVTGVSPSLWGALGCVQ